MSMTLMMQIPVLAFLLATLVYCGVLARRVKSLNDLETGLGGAIAVMTSEIDRLDRALAAAKADALKATEALSREIERAKEERAFWILQQQFSQNGGSTPVGRLRRRKRKDALEDA